MRFGLTEFLLVLLIAVLAFGPRVSAWMNRWSRQARATRAEDARRRAAWEAERRARRDFILHRFQIAAAVLAILTAAALVYTLGFRPIEAEPQSYTLPAAAAPAGGQSISDTAALAVEGYQPPDCIQVRDGWIYLAARPAEGEGSALLRMREDGSGLMTVLTEEGRITAFAFDPAGDIWYTVLTGEGGALCRASHDGWGATAEQVVTQIDGRRLTYPAAVAAGPDGQIYFTQAADFGPQAGSLDEALRSELIGHTATGWVYAYDPAGRAVRRVMGGIAGAAGLALSPDGETLYVSDLGSRCIWAVDAAGRELTAGGKGCRLFAGDLPGYPTALAVDADSSVYVTYPWAAARWLEDRAADPGIRGIAARLPRSVQRSLFAACPAAAQSFRPDGSLEADYAADAVASGALAPSGNRLYLPGAEGGVCYFRL